MATLLAVSEVDDYEVSHDPSIQSDSPTIDVVSR
jgi:hypothetical protein